MKWRIFLFVALIMGGIAGTWIKNLSGLLIIVSDKTSYEIRLWFAISILFLLFLFMSFLLQLIRNIFVAPFKVNRWNIYRRWKNAQKKRLQALLLYSKGNWRMAEKKMMSATKYSEEKWLNYLVAAKAADHQHADDRREAYFRAAYHVAPYADLAIGMEQAELYLKNAHYEHALAILTQLKKKYSTHSSLLRLLALAYRSLNDWPSLVQLLPLLKKKSVYLPEQLNELETMSIRCFLLEEDQKTSKYSLKERWKILAPYLQLKEKHHRLYIHLLILNKEMDLAETLIRPYFKKLSNEKMIALYYTIRSKRPAQHFDYLKAYALRFKQTSMTLHLALGITAYYAEQWTEAECYLKKSLNDEKTIEGHFFIGKTYEQLNNQTLAHDYFQHTLTQMMDEKMHSYYTV
jgi:HemY protein